MLQHENPNITVLNKNLWAVRFSLIPYIPQIKVTCDYADNIAKERFLLLDTGLVLLNEDVSIYPIMQAAFMAVMKLKSRTIEKEYNLYKTGQLMKTSPKSLAYYVALLVERERRKIMKGGAA